MDMVLMYVTVADTDEARRIGRALVGEGLCACANILENMRSIYRWQGEVTEGSEAVLLVKTAAARSATVRERIIALHSYELPCVLEFPVGSGHAPFIDWVLQESTDTGKQD